MKQLQEESASKLTHTLTTLTNQTHKNQLTTPSTDELKPPTQTHSRPQSFRHSQAQTPTGTQTKQDNTQP